MAKKSAGGEKRVSPLALRRAAAREHGLAVYRRMMAYAKESGLDAKTVARKAGLREMQMSRWNLSKPEGAGPSYGDLVLIADALGRPLAEFLGDETPAPTSLGVHSAKAGRMVLRLARAVRRFELALREIERGDLAGPDAAPRPGAPHAGAQGANLPEPNPGKRDGRRKA